jgi:transcriptional regulator with XRE-family HTH domain
MSPGVILRDARRARGLTQAALAERLGKSQATIAELERPESNRSSVDETLIERNLALSPRERLQAFEVAHAEVEQLRESMRRAKAR